MPEFNTSTYFLVASDDAGVALYISIGNFTAQWRSDGDQLLESLKSGTRYISQSGRLRVENYNRDYVTVTIDKLFTIVKRTNLIKALETT